MSIRNKSNGCCRSHPRRAARYLEAQLVPISKALLLPAASGSASSKEEKEDDRDGGRRNTYRRFNSTPIKTLMRIGNFWKGVLKPKHFGTMGRFGSIKEIG